MIIEHETLFNQYLSAIKNNDIETLLTFKDNTNFYLYKNFNKEFDDYNNFANCTIDTLDTLVDISPNIEVPKQLYNNKNGISFEQYILKKILENLPSALRFSQFNHETFSWFHKDEESKLSSYYSLEVIKNFLKETIFEEIFTSTHTIIVEKYNNLITPMFEAVTNEKNWQFFLNSPLYSPYMINFFEQHNNPEDLAKLMSNAFKNGNKFHIERLFNLGKVFPINDNPAYSLLFATIKHKDAIEFVVENIDDIAISNHIILRTIFSHNSNDELRELGSFILDKYNVEQLEDIIKFCEKKIDSGVAKEENFNLIKNYYFEAKVPHKNYVKNKIKI